MVIPRGSFVYLRVLRGLKNELNHKGHEGTRRNIIGTMSLPFFMEEIA